MVRIQDLHCQTRWDLPVKKESSEHEISSFYSIHNLHPPLPSHLPRRDSEAPLSDSVRSSSFAKHGTLSNPDNPDILAMSTITWSPHSGVRGARSNTPQRSRSGHETYSLSQPFMADGAMRSGSSSSNVTSSLTGAVGDSVHRGSRSPPTRNDSLFHSSNWSPSQSAMLGTPQSSYQGILTYDVTSFFDPTMIRNSSPESNSSGSSNFGNTIFDPYSQPGMRQPASGYSLPTQPPHPSVAAEDQLKADILTLRQRLRDAEAETSRLRAALEGVHAKDSAPTLSPSASFQEDWKTRTEIRRKMLCSLNRAGNALCAWHDSRRERRSFPPRNAPPGYLNCGCTHEEALFEESLSRHGVGSYYPGESVRMDPALRNPLLKLLQQRYGYQDGDFERNPLTGEWVRGEGAACWQSQIQHGSSSRRRVETDRH